MAGIFQWVQIVADLNKNPDLVDLNTIYAILE